MSSTSIDQLVQLIVTRHDGGPASASLFRQEEPRFDTHLRQAESADTSSAPAASPQADADRNDSQQRGPTDVDQPAERSAESNAPPLEGSTARTSNDTDQRAESANDAADAEQGEPDQAADAAVDVGGQAALLAENDEPQETQQGTREAAAAVEPQGHTEHVDAIVVTDTTVVDETSDVSAGAAEADESDVESPANITANKPADGGTADSRATTAKLQHERQSNLAVAPGKTATGVEPAAVGVETNDTSGAELGEALPDDEANSKSLDVREDRSQRTLRTTAGPSDQETALARQSARAEALIGDGEQRPVVHDAKLSKESATKPSDEVDAADHHDQSSEREARVGRPRPTSGVRANSAQTALAASVDAKLATAEGTAATEATGDSGVKKVAADTKDGLLTTFGRLERNGPLGARAAHRPDGGQNTPHVDPARFISRVARAIHTANERGGPLQLRLSPPELGSLRLELSVKQGVLTASVETDTSTARQMLLDNLPALRDRLAEQNVRIERFDVDVRRDGGDQPRFGTQHQEHEQQQESAPPRGAQSTRDSGSGDGIVDAAPVRPTITDTSINVIA